jgi:hypothetical protein
VMNALAITNSIKMTQIRLSITLSFKLVNIM